MDVVISVLKGAKTAAVKLKYCYTTRIYDEI